MSFLPPERPGRAAAPETVATRAAITGAIRAGVWRTEPQPDERTIAGVRCLVHGAHREDRGTVVHFHGGAFRIGAPEQIGLFAAALAERCDVRVVCPAYRLAPENPYPAALNDGRAVLAALRAESANPVLLSGYSAGGGLAASLALTARSDATILAGLALLSPWLDLRVSASAFVLNAATDPLFSAEAATTAAELYLQGRDAVDPIVSPLLGSPDAFPPAYVNVGSGEVLLDDARDFAARLTEAGTDCRLDVVPDMKHVAVTRDLTSIGAPHTFARLAAFVTERMTAGTSMVVCRIEPSYQPSR